jgi:hypothetical protein
MVQEKVQEVPLDHFAFVPSRNHEFVEIMGGVDMHNVPQDGPSADLHHWLGP